MVVGGTGLYIDSLLAGREFGAAPGDSGLRERLEAEYAALGPGAMLERLRAVDPERAGRLAPGTRSGSCGPWRSIFSPARPLRNMTGAAGPSRPGTNPGASP